LRRTKSSELKKGYYPSERALVDQIKKHVGAPSAKSIKFKTIECQIMDVADDIAYSTYDLEDAMKGGFTHPLALLGRLGNRSLIKRIHDKVVKSVDGATEQDVFDALTDLLHLDADGGSALDAYTQSKLIASDSRMRTAYSSELVGRFMEGISVRPLPGKDLRFSPIEVRREIQMKIESLKYLNYFLTIMAPRLKVVEYRGYDVVRTIFTALDSDDGHLLLPDDVQSLFERLPDTDSKKRLICDFVAGMTDRYAVEFYSRLTETGATIFKPI